MSFRGTFRVVFRFMKLFFPVVARAGSPPVGRASLLSLRALAVLLAALGAASPVGAGSWRDEPYDYVVLDQDVRSALNEFGRNLAIPVVLSDAVGGRIQGRITATRAGDFLEKLARGSGLTWYFDGSVLHVSADKEFATRVFDAGSLTGEAVVKRMEGLGLADRRFPLRSMGGNIAASGPPAYLALVGELVQRMQSELVAAAEASRVWVFRGGIGTEIVTVGSDGRVAYGATDNQTFQQNNPQHP